MRATFTDSLLNNAYNDNRSLEKIRYTTEEAEEPNPLNYEKQIEVDEDGDGNVISESVGQVAGGFIDALNEMGTLFNYVSGADVSLPDISVAGYDLTVDGQLNTTDYADSGVGGFIRGLSQFATGFLIPGGLAVKGLSYIPKAGAVIQGNSLIRTMVKSGIADFTSFGANDPRLANMLREYGGLRDPITEYLSAPEGDEELDSELDGRMKNLIEGAGLGFAFEGILSGLKWTRNGLRRTQKAIQEDTLRDVDELIADPLDEGMSPQVDEGVKMDVDGKPVIFAQFTDEFIEGLGKRDVEFDDYLNKNTDGLDFNINTIEDDNQIRNAIVEIGARFKDIGVLGRLGTGATETITDATGKTRVGAKTHKKTKSEAEKLVKSLAQNSLGTVEFINKTYMGVDRLHENAVAVQILMQKSAKKLYELAEYASKNEVAPEFRGVNIDHGITRTQMAFQRQKAIHAGIQSEALGVKSEIGRALNALKIDSSSKAAQDAQVRFFQDSFGGVGTIQKDAERVLRFANDADSVKKASKIAKGYEPTFRGKVKQGLLQVYINGILSGVDSTMANSAGNIMAVGTMLEERLVAGTLNSMGKLFGGKGDGVELSESFALAHGVKMGLAEGWNAMAYAFKKDTTSNKMWVKQELAQRNVITAENFNVGGAFGSFIDLVGTATRLPSRLLLSNDEFFRGLSYNMEKHAQAWAYSRKSLKENSLNREAFNETYNRIRNMSPNELRQYADLEGIDLEAQQATLRNIFADPAQNRVTRAIDRVRQELPFGIGQVYIPFYNTILNILKWTGERTPGVNFMMEGTTLRDLATKGSRARQLALAKNATGVAMYSYAYSLAENGMITGSLPQNLNQRMNLLEKGVTPYAFVTEDGYVPFNRLDPIGTMFGLAADVHNLVKIYNDPKFLEQGERDFLNSKLMDLVTQGVYQLHSLAEDKAMLRGYANLVAVFSQDPLRKKDALKQLVNAYNPIVSFYSALRGDSARAFDNVVRQTGSADFYTDLWNDYYKRNPEALRILGPVSPIHALGKPKGFTGDLMPRLNYLGEPVKASTFNSGDDKYFHVAQAYLSPVPIRRKDKSLLLKKITELNVQSKPPSRWRSLIVRGKFGTDTIALTAEERHFWAKTAGELNKKYLEPALNRKLFKNRPEGQQRLFIERTLRKHKMIGKKRLLRTFPRLRQRIQEFKLFDREQRQKPASVNQAFLN